MIQRIRKGRGVGGCVRYVRNKPGAEIIGGCYDKAASASEISASLGRIAHSVAVSRPVFHVALSLAPGEILTNAQWNSVARAYLQAQGLDDSPFLVVRHTDTARDHIHVIASRVSYAGKLVPDSNDFNRGMAVLRRFDKELALQSPEGSRQVRGLSQGEFQEARRKGDPNIRRELQDLVRRAAAGEPDLPTFVRRLALDGATARFNTSDAGDVRGWTVGYKGMSFPGSSLGRSLSWQGLRTEHGLRYSSTQHREILLQNRHEPRRGSVSSWPSGALESLARNLGELRPGTGRTVLRSAAAALLGRGHEALSTTAGALHLITAVRHPLRTVLRHAPGGDTLSFGLAFLGAFSSPALGVAFGASLLSRVLSRSSRSGRENATGVLEQYLRAAASDRPAGALFVSRLAECGVELRTDKAGNISFCIGDLTIQSQHLGGAFSGKALNRLLGDALDGRIAPPDRSVAGPPAWNSQGPGGPARDLERTPGPVAVVVGDVDRPAAPTASSRGLDTRDREGLGAGRARDEHAPGLRPADVAALDRRLGASHSPHPGGDVRRPYPLPAGVEPHERAAPPTGAGPGHQRGVLPSQPEGTTRAAGPSAPDRALAEVVSAHLRALNSPTVEIRIGIGASSRFLENLTPQNVLGRLPELLAANRCGLPICVRASGRAGAQFCCLSDSDTVGRAAARGFEPAALIEAGGRLGVWMQHAPAPEAVRPFLDRAVRLVFDTAPKTAGRSFGPLAGFEVHGQLVRLREASGEAYSMAPRIAATLTAARAERVHQLGAKLSAAGVVNLTTFRGSFEGQAKGADTAWARLALQRGVSQADVVSVLVTQGAERYATPQRALSHATRTLAAALGVARDQAPKLLQIAASAAGLSVRVLSTAMKVLRMAERLAR